MAKTESRAGIKRYLRVQRTPEKKLHQPTMGYLDGHLKKRGFVGFDQPQEEAPFHEDIPRGYGRKRLHYGEGFAVAKVIADYSTKSGEGLTFDSSKWTLADVRVDKNGIEHVSYLGKGPMSWIGRVRRVFNSNLHEAKQSVNHAIHTDFASIYTGQNPIHEALEREARERRRIYQAELDSPFARFFATGRDLLSIRARLAGLAFEGIPSHAADSFLNPGSSRDIMKQQLTVMIQQVADEQLDPANVIHGPTEGAVTLLQRFQEGFAGTLLNQKLATSELFDDFRGIITSANKFFSRDVLTEMTPQGIIRTLRRNAGTAAYNTWYATHLSGKGFGKFMGRWLLPPPEIAEEGTDRNMQRANIARLAKTEAILTTNNWKTGLERDYQCVVAEEFIAAYDTPAPTLEQLTYKIFGGAEKGLAKTEKGIKDAAIDMQQKVKDTYNSIAPKPLRLQAHEEASKPADPRDMVKAAVEAYGGHPMTTKQQVDAILAHADDVLELTVLGKEERVLWERAKAYAQRFDQLHNVAQRIVHPNAPTPEAAGATSPVAASV